MASIITNVDENGNKVLDVNMEDDTEVTLATANTYVDKNIIIRIASALNVEVATVEETLAFLNIKIPDLTKEEF